MADLLVIFSWRPWSPVKNLYEKPSSDREVVITRTSYPSDLTDAQWMLIEPLIPKPLPGGRPRSAQMRQVVNAILYINRSGNA